MTNISFIPKGRVAVYVSERDTSVRVLEFKLDLVPEGAITLEGTRPSGETFTAPTVKDGQLVRLLTELKITNEPGIVRAQLVARNGESRIGSQGIDLMVEPINRRIR